jgi:putative flippase GtrA
MDLKKPTSGAIEARKMTSDSIILIIKGNRLVKFILVGLLNTAFGYSIFAIAILLGSPPQLALVLQFFVGCVWNYFMHARLVFEHDGYRQMPLYFLAYISIYFVNAVTLALIIRAGATPLLAQAILTPFIAVLSYLLISKILKPRDSE